VFDRWWWWWLNGKRENKEREGGLTSGVAISSFFCAGVSRMHAQKKKKQTLLTSGERMGGNPKQRRREAFHWCFDFECFLLFRCIDSSRIKKKGLWPIYWSRLTRVVFQSFLPSGEEILLFEFFLSRVGVDNFSCMFRLVKNRAANR